MPQTKLILNSANRTSGKSHCCKFILRNPGIQATSYSVKKIEVPHSFYNITDLNNKIDWDDNGAVNLTSTLTNGNYSIDALLTHIGAVMTADSFNSGTGTASFTLSRDSNTKKISITNNLLENFDINWGASDITKQLAYDLGFFPTQSQEDNGRPVPVSVNAQSTHTASNTYWIGSPKNILIKSNLANRAFKPSCFTLAKGGGTANILEQLLVNTVAGEITTKEFINPIVVPMNPSNTLFDIDFELVDENLNPLDLNGREWSIQIVFDLADNY